MNGAVLTIKPNGTVVGIYTEIIPFNEIGALKINRMTEIEFNNATQEWEAKDMAGTLSFSHRSRQRCLAWEHQHFSR